MHCFLVITFPRQSATNQVSVAVWHIDQAFSKGSIFAYLATGVNFSSGSYLFVPQWQFVLPKHNFQSFGDVKVVLLTTGGSLGPGL